MKKFIIPVMLPLIMLACSKENQELQMQPSGISGKKEIITPKTIKIAVLSDLHFMDPSVLQADGSAFQMYLIKDPKLLQESGAILEQIIRRLLTEKPDLVLITGDLSKDGELISHQTLIEQLQILTENNIRVLVVPGNHDINNPDALYFNGDNITPAEKTSAEEFESLYSDFGFNTAISRDGSSLSYVSEPFKNLRILALDANEYYDNTETFCVTDGKIKDGTMEWAKEQLEDAKDKGIAVIGMMHHGLLEHFPGESVLFADYLVDDYEARADELIQAGLRVILTGHFHSHDAVGRTNSYGSLVDLETGSPVIYDSPYRIMNLTDGKLAVKTENIDKIIYPGLTGNSFSDYEESFSRNGIEIQAKYMLMAEPFNTDEATATQLAPIFAQAMMIHFAGDEIISDEAQSQIEYISGLSPEMAGILQGLYTDLPPADNNLTVDLN